MTETDPTTWAGIGASIIGPSIVYVINHLKNSNFSNRMTALETKIEPFWNIIIKNAPEFLHSDDTPIFDGLIKKIETHTATYEELILFRQLLEQKIQEMVANKDYNKFVFAAAYLVKVNNLIKEMKK